jgi:hypothetical protein
VPFLLKKFLRYGSEHPHSWDGGAQRNVYISGHCLGYPGIASRPVFYNLDKLKSHDEGTLKTMRLGFTGTGSVRASRLYRTTLG